ncbi:hypothetical protein [Streptomyces sp. NBC_00354]|uniref:hypothetical protein n=1 Tax=Streptomyces sp. NBC_00354 TaxID=2975723 RepID=UPI002E25CA6E
MTADSVPPLLVDGDAEDGAAARGESLPGVEQALGAVGVRWIEQHRASREGIWPASDHLHPGLVRNWATEPRTHRRMGTPLARPGPAAASRAVRWHCDA